MTQGQVINLQEPTNGIMPLNDPHFMPVISGQVWQDWEKYLEEMEEIGMLKEQIEKLAASLKTMKNAMWGIQEVMGAIMNYQGAQVAAFSSVQNVDSDLQSAFGSAQSNFNGMQTGTNKTDVQDAKGLLAFIQKMEAFLKYQESLGNKSVFGQGVLKNLQSAIDSIKSQFGNSWGNPTEMAAYVGLWVNSIKHGQSSPEIKAIQDGFQQLDQATGAESATANTQLQFLTNVYKQILGIDQSFIKTYTTLTGQMVQKMGQN